MPSLRQEYVNWLPQNQVTNDIVHVYIDPEWNEMGQGELFSNS